MSARTPVGPPEAKARALSPKQAEVLRLAAKGLTHKDIAADLGNSPKTIRNLLVVIYDKLGIHTRAEATLAAVRLGLIEL